MTILTLKFLWSFQIACIRCRLNWRQWLLDGVRHPINLNKFLKTSTNERGILKPTTFWICFVSFVPDFKKLPSPISVWSSLFWSLISHEKAFLIHVDSITIYFRESINDEYFYQHCISAECKVMSELRQTTMLPMIFLVFCSISRQRFS